MRKAIKFFLVSILILTFTGEDFVAAEEKTRSLDDIQVEQNQLAEQQEQKNKELSEIMQSIEQQEAEITGLEEIIRRNKEDVLKAEEAVQKVEEEIAKLEEEIDKRREIMDERLKATQEKGNASYLDMLFESTSLVDLVDRASAIATLLEADKNLLEEIEKGVRELNLKLAESKQLKEDLKEIQDANSEQKQELETKTEEMKQEKEDLLTEVEKLKISEEELEQLKEEVRESMNMKVSLGGGTFEWPTDGGYISSGQGTRIHPITGEPKLHKGIDIARTDKSISPPIYAGEAGKVVFAGEYGGLGNMVRIDHGNGVETVYGHLDSIKVKVGDNVQRGQGVGIMGTTGASTGIHLHFEVYVNGAVQNPMGYLGEK